LDLRLICSEASSKEVSAIVLVFILIIPANTSNACNVEGFSELHLRHVSHLRLEVVVLLPKPHVLSQAQDLRSFMQNQSSGSPSFFTLDVSLDVKVVQVIRVGA
jgi:hypothetical protein